MNNKANIAQFIIEKAKERGALKSTCPSEIARELYPADWRKHMAEIRFAAIDLHKSGKVKLTQKGIAVDPDHFKGPIRIKIGKS
ncbi:DUF3253 domain-containing protein [Mucilaginibacter corticis]|uniref:DUF3253 domain-containing protein n=1 Tax=Mucilaginibacter corticis TaxID=2597670 RepID=A0A556M8W7_9SPHI|nr:DUF3253 domain-containing protein [Mucilaginibacter corticis]TSJ36342.1 DUF3253 domain-containing protein [Mucilaginibacter corticis]